MTARMPIPMINVPPMVKALAGTIFLVFLLTWFLDGDEMALLMDRYAFIPARYLHGGFTSYEGFISIITYMFLHGGWLHVGVNLLMLAAFGTPLEKSLGSGRFLIFFLICGVLGAAFYWVLNMTSEAYVIGTSGAISGLFGGLVWMLRRDRRSMATMVIVWLLLNVFTGLTFSMDGGGIAWEVHMGGFLAGLALFPRFVR